MNRLQAQGVTPIEVQAELAEAEENAVRLREALYENPGEGMERWLATYIGTEIAVALGSEDAYRILDRANATSWQSGGCDALTAVLCELFPGEAYGLMREGGMIDHFVCEAHGYFFDADGAYTADELVAKHRAVEDVPVVLEPLDQATMQRELSNGYSDFTLRRVLDDLRELLNERVSWQRIADEEVP